MTAMDAIREADRLRPNSFPAEDKLRWLARLEARIREEILQRYEGEIPTTEETSAAEQKEETDMRLLINDTPVEVLWEDNEAVTALRELVRDGALTVAMSPYGGFEQVGPIGRSLPRADSRITTEAGDIVLYSGDQIVVFYGSNTWAYTRLGKIQGLDGAALTSLLGGGAVTLTITD